MSYNSKVRGIYGPEKKQTQGLNWTYDYRSWAFMHVIHLYLHLSFLKTKSKKCIHYVWFMFSRTDFENTENIMVLFQNYVCYLNLGSAWFIFFEN